MPTTPSPSIVLDPADQYPARAAVCLATGHQPVLWRTGDTLRALCEACGRTWPYEWLPVLSMPGIAPSERWEHAA